MSLFIVGAVVGSSLAVLGLVLAAVIIGVHCQERAASLGHRPASLSASLARRVLGLHVRAPDEATAVRSPRRRHPYSEGDDPMTTEHLASHPATIPSTKEDASCP